MDVNQTRFHLVWGRDGFLRGQVEGLEYDIAHQALSLSRKLFRFPRRSFEAPLTPSQRRGAGVDRYGNRYWIADTRNEIRFLSRGSRTSERFWPVTAAACPPEGIFTPAAPPEIPRLAFSGLAVTCDHYLVCGVPDAPGILIFDLAGGGGPRLLRWPAGVPFSPFDLAARPGGGVWILDREHRALWGLSSTFQPVVMGAPPAESEVIDDFFPQGDAPAAIHHVPGAPSLDHAVSLPFAEAAAVEGLPDGTVLVLEQRFLPEPYSVVHRFGCSTYLGAFALDRALEPFLPANSGSPAVPGHDMVWARNLLFLVDTAGNQAFAFRFTEHGGTFDLAIEPTYYPMREFTGKALIAGAGDVFYDSGELWFTLAEQPRPRFETQGRLRAAGPSSDVFDSGIPGCVWHRVFIDGCFPPGCEALVETRAAEDQEDLPAAIWRSEPAPYDRGSSELAWLPEGTEGGSTRETLLQQARGRFLQLRLTLTGTGRTSPLIRSLRLYYPRFSYLEKYVPAVYREDAISASFLDRFLANTEGVFTALEGRIQDVQALFDSRTVPASYLDWLASWLGAVFDPTFDEPRRRLFMAFAMKIYASRGTPRGIVNALRLALDECPDASIFESHTTRCASTPGFSIRLVERFLTRRTPGVLLGDPEDVLGPGSTVAAAHWTPAEGAAPLDRRWREFLSAQRPSIIQLNDEWKLSGADRYTGFDDPRLRLPAVVPECMPQYELWTLFVRGYLGFTYALPGPRAVAVFRQYVARLYRQPQELNKAYGLSGSAALQSWGDVEIKLWNGRLRYTLPSGGRFLQDWIHFVSAVLPAYELAHSFTVLIPVRLEQTPAEQQRRLDLAGRITEIEKPAHTSFDLKLYYALFRAGEARLGIDTILGPSSRFAGIVLGEQALATGFLQYLPPWTVQGRPVVGREAVALPGARER